MATVAAQKLLIYNNALTICGERTLASLTEAREPRRLLDLAWDTGAIQWCLEQGLWHFAIRSQKLDYTSSIEPPFGYKRAFDKPTDWVRTVAVCSDEYFKMPLLQHQDEGGFWFADLDTIYVRFVSNDASFGNDMGAWPQTFQKFLQAYLASEVVDKLTQNEAKRKEVKEVVLTQAKMDALAKDALNETTRFAPPGSWTTSRRGRRSHWDHGYRTGNLY